MTTDANFVGGGDNANPNRLNGKNQGQTANSSPSAAQLDQQADKSADQKDYGVPGLSKFFAKYPALTDLHKKMLAALYADGESMQVVKKAARLLLGSEEYDANANEPQEDGFSVKELWELQEAYNLADSDMDMLGSLFESGCSSEVIISKAKKLANLAEVEGSPFATNYPQAPNEEFINSLVQGYDLTPDDIMTIAGMVQRGVPRDLIERTANRFRQYPTMANIINHVLDLKGDQPEKKAS